MSFAVDVAIVGAGAAGLAATARAYELGLSCYLLEAKPRIGGRVHTDKKSLGAAWDRGAHWLHSADVNPLTKIADELGHAYVMRPRAFDGHFHLGTGWAEGGEYRAYREAFEKADESAVVAGWEGRDIAALDVMDNGSRWARMVHHIFTAPVRSLQTSPPLILPLIAIRGRTGRWYRAMARCLRRFMHGCLLSFPRPSPP